MKHDAIEIHIDPVADLRARKQSLIDQINRAYDPLIALALENSGRGAAARSRDQASEGAAAGTDLAEEATNAESVLWALRQRGGSATITEILKTLPKRHALQARQKPAKAVSGVLGVLRGEKLVEKGDGGRFLLTKR